MSQNRIELIEVQHCHDTVIPTNVQDFNSKAFFFKDMCPSCNYSKCIRYLTKVKIMKCTISLNFDDVDVEFVRSRTFLIKIN